MGLTTSLFLTLIVSAKVMGYLHLHNYSLHLAQRTSLVIFAIMDLQQGRGTSKAQQATSIA